MGVRIRQKGGKWYVFINHQGERKAKCIGDDKRLARQVKRQLEAKLTLGEVGLLKAEPATVLFGDYAHRFIHVQRTYDPVHNRMNTPKSGKTRRVDMAQDLRQVLLEWQARCFDQAVMAGRSTPHAVVFATASGRPWAPASLYYIYKRACALAGLRATRIHDLRHSYATILLYELPAPIQYVSEQLGHASITLTVNTYGHPRQGW